MKKGFIFGIQHFSIHDGPGIRSTVFLKGCPLRCLWCHNPEGLSCGIGIQYYENECFKCGHCGNIYENMEHVELLSEEEKHRLAKECPGHALRLVGEYMSVEQVMEQIMKDYRYFRSSQGGITISGGEPMMQPSFSIELARAAKKSGITVSLETSGFSSIENYRSIMPYVDTFLWDYKATTDEMHKRLTGVSERKILRNLDELYRNGAQIVLRCPLVPEVNDTEEHLKGIAEITKKYPKLKGIEIMPYHKMGVSKAKRTGILQKEYQVPQKEKKMYWVEKIKEYGGKVTYVN